MAAKNTSTGKSKIKTEDTHAIATSAPTAQTAPVAESAAEVSAKGGGESSSELVSELAYQKYLARGGSHGSDVQDWLDAEHEVAEHRLAHANSKPN